MKEIGFLGGGAPLIKEYAVASTIARTGIWMIAPAACGAGLATSTTTNVDNAVGLVVGLADKLGVYATAQQTDGSDPEGTVKVIVNPDLIVEANFTGDASDGTALTLYPVTTADSAGLAITTASAWNCPTYDEGVVWGYDGANPGKIRAITSVSATAGTVTVAFPNDTVVGDNFLRAPVYPGRANTVTLNTNLTQVRADLAVATNTAALVCIQVRGLLKDIGGEGRTKSSAYFVSGNHILGAIAN